MPIYIGHLGWGQERVVESFKVLIVTGLHFHSGISPCERAVSLRYVSSPRPTKLTATFRWFCEPAYEKLRGTDEATVNRYLLQLLR